MRTHLDMDIKHCGLRSLKPDGIHEEQKIKIKDNVKHIITSRKYSIIIIFPNYAQYVTRQTPCPMDQGHC
jgi:hypothetical protein